MEFGKLENVDRVRWDLPSDDPQTIAFLKDLKSPHFSEDFVGAPAWGHKEWVGSIYPVKTKAADYLFHYSRYFSCIELNSSHYRIPSPEQTQKWLTQVPENFLFCAKVFQDISHSQTGLVDKELLKEWFQFLEGLKSNRGPSFLQLPPHFDYGMKALLFRFLQLWPKEFELAIEFRHPSWFVDGKVLPALVQYLQSQKIGLVITDVAGRRDVLHTSISSDFTFLRFIGNNLHPSDFTRAQAWLLRFQAWHELGLKRIFLIVHEPDDIKTPEMSEFFFRELRVR